MFLLTAIAASTASATLPPLTQCATSPAADQIFTFETRFAQFSAVGDFNGDGIDDVAATRSERAWYHIDLLAGSPAGMSRQSTLFNFAANYAWIPMTAADVNGDGIDDLVVMRDGNLLQVLLGGPAGFTIGWSVTLPDYIDNLFAVGDQNGDGYEDLLVLHGTDWFGVDATADIYPGGPESFGAPIFSSIVPRRVTVLAIPGDLDGDGVLDLVFDRYNGDLVLWRSSNQREIIITPDPSITFIRAVQPVGDLDGDGLVDLVVVGDNRRATYYYYYGQTTPGDYGMVAEIHLSRMAGTTEPIATRQLALTQLAYAVTSLGDRDSNGFDELVFGSALATWDPVTYDTVWSGTLQTFEITANGFVPREVWVSDSNCGIVQDRLLPGDFNGDGVMDVSATLPWEFITNPPIQSAFMTFLSDPSAATTPTTPTTPPTETTPTPTDPTTPTGGGTAQQPPDPDYGCGCGGSSRSQSAVWVLGLAMLRRRRLV